MTVALDLGASEFRSVRREEGRLIARRIPAVYVVSPDSPEQRHLFEQMRVPFSRSQSYLLIVGKDAQTVAGTLNLPRIPVLHRGQVPTKDPVGRQLCDILLGAVLPQRDPLPDAVYFTVPGGLGAHGPAPSLTQQFFQQLLRLKFRHVRVVQPATAVVLAELADSGFTGIGMTIGSESVSFSICRLGQPQLEWTFRSGGRSILLAIARLRHHYLWDSAGNVFLDTRHLESMLFDREFDITSPRSGEERLLRDGYRDLLGQAFDGLSLVLDQAKSLSLGRDPLPLIASGGPMKLKGFTDLLNTAIVDGALPIRVLPATPATMDPYTVARGVLVMAHLEQRSQHVA